MQTKIEELNKGYLEPEIQMSLIEHLKAQPKKALIVLAAEGETAEEIVAAWIYQHCLTPLGWKQ